MPKIRKEEREKSQSLKLNGEGNLIKCCQKFNKRLNQNEVDETKMTFQPPLSKPSVIRTYESTEFF